MPKITFRRKDESDFHLTEADLAAMDELNLTGTISEAAREAAMKEFQRAVEDARLNFKIDHDAAVRLMQKRRPRLFKATRLNAVVRNLADVAVA